MAQNRVCDITHLWLPVSQTAVQAADIISPAQTHTHTHVHSTSPSSRTYWEFHVVHRGLTASNTVNLTPSQVVTHAHILHMYTAVIVEMRGRTSSCQWQQCVPSVCQSLRTLCMKLKGQRSHLYMTLCVCVCGPGIAAQGCLLPLSSLCREEEWRIYGDPRLPWRPIQPWPWNETLSLWKTVAVYFGNVSRFELLSSRQNIFTWHFIAEWDETLHTSKGDK